jgi:hypothetical protein
MTVLVAGLPAGCASAPLRRTSPGPLPSTPAPAASHGDPKARRAAAPNLSRRPGLRLDLLRLQALSYATSLGAPVLAVHVSTDPHDAKEFRRHWEAWGAHVPLEIIQSPYRATLAPLARYLQDLHAQRPDLTLNLVLPELVPASVLQRPLHNGLARRLTRLMRSKPWVTVTPVPFKTPA